MRGERKIKAISAGLSGDDDGSIVSSTVQKIADGQQRVEEALTMQADALSQLNDTLSQLLRVATAPKTATMPDGRRITIASGQSDQTLQ